MVIREYLAGIAHEAQDESLRRAYSLARRDPRARMLDCGCGDGSLTLATAEVIGTRDLWGIEIDPEPAHEAARRGIQVVSADLNARLPFADASFDVALAYRIFTNLWNSDLFIRELHRVLSPGGYVLLLQANLASFHNAAFLIAGLQPPGAPSSNENGHLGAWVPEQPKRLSPLAVRAITLSGLRAVLQYHGFTVDGVGGAGYYPLPGALARPLASHDPRHAGWVAVRATKPLEPAS